MHVVRQIKRLRRSKFMGFCAKLKIIAVEIQLLNALLPLQIPHLSTFLSMLRGLIHTYVQRTSFSRRFFTSSSSSHSAITIALSSKLTSLSPEISESLHNNGYWVNEEPLLPQSQILGLRNESIELRNEGRFEQR